MLATTNRVVERQAELWHTTVDTAQERWNRLAHAQEQQMETALAGALSTSLERYADRLMAAEQIVAEQNRQHWNAVQQSLAQTAETLVAQQTQLVRQGEILLQVVEATGQVTRLEDALNHNLAALGTTHNFAETLVSLSAALNLLTARLNAADADRRQVTLKRSAVEGQAA